MQYFFHESIKNYTVALLDLFNDLYIPRFNEDGTRISDMPVSIKFGNRDKAYLLSEHDLENINNGNVNTLPRMILEFNSIAKAGTRDTNKNHKINKRKIDDEHESLMYEYHYNAVAYDFYFTIYIATRTFTDATILIEQIAPMFRPDLTLKIQEMDIQEVPTSVPVRLGDFDIDLPSLDPDEIRLIEVTFPLTVLGNLYLPIKDAAVIKEIDLHMHAIREELSSKAGSYEIDNIPSTIKTNTDGITEDSIENATSTKVDYDLTKGDLTPEERINFE